jgi:hypothetical protein
MELASIPDPQDKWAKTIEVARLADPAQLHSIWV